MMSNAFSSVQFSHSVFANPWTAAHQAYLFITSSQTLLKRMSIKSVIPSNHLILGHPLLLPPSTFPSIRFFAYESVLRIRWQTYWSFSFSFSISPSSEYSGLPTPLFLGFRGGSDGKEYSCNAGHLGSIHGLGSPGEGNGNPLQYSCLENSWTEELSGYSSWGCKESDTTQWLFTSLSLHGIFLRFLKISIMVYYGNSSVSFSLLFLWSSLRSLTEHT